MNRLIRGFLLLPALIIALVVIPTVVFSASSDGADLFLSGGVSDHRSTLFQSIDPTPAGTVPNGTVPGPTPTRSPVIVHPPTPPHHHRPPVRQPHAVPTPIVPTATATPTGPQDEAVIGKERIEKVIGDRLSSVIYAFTESGWLYRADDNGRVWSLMSTQPGVDDFVMSAANPDVLYSGAGIPCSDGITGSVPMLKSIDGGVTWTELPNSANMRPLLAHPGDTDSLFAADCEMLYLTTDGGLTWEAKPDSSPDGLWTNYRVVDMAASSLLGDPQPTTPNWNQLFAAGLDASGTGVVAFSNDLGDTWVRLTPNIDPAPWGMSALAADPFIEGLVTFAEPKSVWFTENFGVNWQVTTKGLSNVVARSGSGAAFGLNDIVHHPSDQLYLATARGLYTKAATADTWTKIEDTSFDLIELTGILFTESSPNKLWLNSVDGVFTYEIE
ncbi:MAG: hypothetical protein R3C14_53830 [Caldilineaceae bacterium]